MNRTDRLFGIVLQLQQSGQLRAQDLAAHFEVSVRTIYRDILALSEAGVPVTATPGQGYALLEGYFLPPLLFTALEAGALALCTDYAAPSLVGPLRAATATAQAKLARALSADASPELRQIQESMSFMPQSRPEHPQLRRLRDAIMGRRVLRIRYQTYGQPDAESGEIEPYGLNHYAGAWHLLAYCRNRRAPRNFRLDRISAVTVLAEHFASRATVHPGPEPRQEHAEDQQVVVLADAEIMCRLREDPPFGLIEERPHRAGALLIFRVPHIEPLLGALLCWGGSIEVLEPPSLRSVMAAHGRRLAARHGAET